MVAWKESAKGRKERMRRSEGRLMVELFLLLLVFVVGGLMGGGEKEQIYKYEGRIMALECQQAQNDIKVLA